MKKRVNWTSVLFLAAVWTAGILLSKISSAMRETELELAVNKALANARRTSKRATADTAANELNGTPLWGAETNAKVPFDEPILEDEPVALEVGYTTNDDFIAMVDLTTSETCDRSRPIVLEPDHDYRLVYTLPKDATNLKLNKAVFQVDWWSVSVDAGEASSLSAVLSDGTTTYTDTITLTANEQSLRLWSGDIAAYVLYSGDEQIGILAPGAVDGLVGAPVFNDNDSDHKTPTHIVYEFRTEALPEESSTTGRTLPKQNSE